MASGVVPRYFDVSPWAKKFGLAGHVELATKTNLPNSSFHPISESNYMFEVLEARRKPNIFLTLFLYPLQKPESTKCIEILKGLSLRIEGDMGNIVDNFWPSIEVLLDGINIPSFQPNLKSAKLKSEVRFIDDFVVLSSYDDRQNPIMIVLEYVQMCNKIKARVMHSSKRYRWGNSNKSVHDFNAFSEFSDIMLQSKDNIKIPAHMFILKAKGFCRLLQNENSINQNGVLRVDNINAKPLMAILNWIYTEQIPDNVVDTFSEFEELAVHLGCLKKIRSKRMKTFSNSDNINQFGVRSMLYYLRSSLMNMPAVIKRSIVRFLKRTTKDKYGELKPRSP